IRQGGGPIEVVRRAGRPHDQQIVIRRSAGLGELANAHTIRAYRRCFVLRVGKRCQSVHALRLERYGEGIIVARAHGLMESWSIRLESGVETWLSGRRVNGQSEERAKTVIVEIVIIFDDDIAAAHLGHEMESLPTMESTDEGFPDAAIRPNGPNAPH